MTSSWKIVKRHGLLLRGACEVVVELAIFRVGGKASHSEGASRLKENKVAFMGGRENSWLPHLSNGDVVSSFEEVNIGIHLRLRVPRLSLYPSYFTCLYIEIAFVLDVIYMLRLSCAHLA